MWKQVKVIVSLLIFVFMVISNFGIQNREVKAATLSDKEVEVVLAVDTASNNLDLTGFSDLLKSKLNSKYGIDGSRVHINTVQSRSVSVSGAGINWCEFDHTNNSQLAVDTDTKLITYYPEAYENLRHDYHIVTSSKAIEFYGYGSPAYKDFLLAPNSVADNKVFKFTLDEAATSYHSGEGAGFLFNARYYKAADGTKKLSAYVVLINGNEYSATEYITLYKLKDINAADFSNEAVYSIDMVAATEGVAVDKWGGKVTLLKRTVKPTPSSGTKRFLKLVVSPDKVSFYQFTDSNYGAVKDRILDNTLLDESFNSFAFGPIASYRRHDCEQDTRFIFSDIEMTEDNALTFTDIVKSTTWHYKGSLRVIANLDNDGVPELGDISELSTTLYYMMRSNTHYVGWGINNDLVPPIGGYNTVKNQAQGFIKRNNGRGTFIDRSIDDTLDKGTEKLAWYIAKQVNLAPIVKKPVIQTKFAKEFLSTGKVICSTTTDKTSLGHRVRAYKWRVMNVAVGKWETKGIAAKIPLTVAASTYNMVSLRIQDAVTGDWSDYAAAYIANAADASPVPLFSLDKSELMPDNLMQTLRTSETVTATDMSFHPDGESITEWDWKVYNSALVEQNDLSKSYTSANKPACISFNFKGKPADKYTIKLRVKKGIGWSRYYSQTVMLYRESNKWNITRTAPKGKHFIMYKDVQNYFFLIKSTAGEKSSYYRIIKLPADNGASIIGDWIPISGVSAIGASSVSDLNCEICIQVKDENCNCKTQPIGVFISLWDTCLCND